DGGGAGLAGHLLLAQVHAPLARSAHAGDPAVAAGVGCRAVVAVDRAAAAVADDAAEQRAGRTDAARVGLAGRVAAHVRYALPLADLGSRAARACDRSAAAVADHAAVVAAGEVARLGGRQ